MDPVFEKRRTLVSAIAEENPIITGILRNRNLNLEQQISEIRNTILQSLREHPKAYAYYTGKESGEKAFFRLSWRDLAFIRVLDYQGRNGLYLPDQNTAGCTA
jgi:hypothetical protein